MVYRTNKCTSWLARNNHIEVLTSKYSALDTIMMIMMMIQKKYIYKTMDNIVNKR